MPAWRRKGNGAQRDLWSTVLPATLTFPRAVTCWTITLVSWVKAQSVRWLSPDPNVQPLIVKLMGEQSVGRSLGTIRTQWKFHFQCLPVRWGLSAKAIQLSVNFTGGSWPSASSKFSCKVAQVSAKGKAQTHGSALWRSKVISGTETNNTLPTLYSGHSSREKKKGQERDKIKFSSDVTSTNQKR